MEIISALQNIVGSDRVSTSKAVCLSYAFNVGYTRDTLRMPDIIVMPETPEQVSEILKAAHQYKVPVTPKGAAGAAGTGGPLKGGILLDLTLMDRIVLIDTVNMKAVAEAGCSFFKLSQELFKNGLMLPIAAYGPGPSVAASAITPPNGLGGARYGPNINLVEGFEVVLPSGEIIRVGSMAYADSDFGPYYRYITGPDLVGLFTKSNGAFGIVTKVAYRCLHRPRHWAFHSYYWPLAKIENFTKAMMEATAVEVFDIHFVDEWWLGEMARMLPDDCYFVLELMVNAETEPELNGKEQVIKGICQNNGGTLLPGFARDLYTRWPTYLWSLGFITEDDRLTDTQAKRPRGHLVLLDEPIYPLSRVPEVYTKIMELSKEHGIWSTQRGPGFDGFIMNSQVICSPVPYSLDDSDPGLVERFHKCQDEFREWFGEKGGTFQYRLPPAVPDFVWTNQSGAFNLLKSIKSLLDPNNILSPGTFELGEM
jgi:FAD/FMN-containing dehydrogenase